MMTTTNIETPPQSQSTMTTSTNTSTIINEIPTHNLYNLTLLDGPKYGWTAASGISTMMLEPHEKARRKSTQMEYFVTLRKKEREEMQLMRRRRTSLLNEERGKDVNTDADEDVDMNVNISGKETSTLDANADNVNLKKRSREESKDNNEHSINYNSRVHNTNTATPNELDTVVAFATAAADINHDKMNTTLQSVQNNTNLTSIHSTQLGFTSTDTTTAATSTQNNNNDVDNNNDNDTFYHQTSPTSLIQTRNQGHHIPLTTNSMKKRKKKKQVEKLEFSALIVENENNENDNNNDVDKKDEEEDEEESKIKLKVNESNHNDKDDSLNNDYSKATPKESSTTTPKIIKLNPYIYHRGIENQEPRDKYSGTLLCPTEPTDTNHEWDDPKLQFNVNVCFPLVDTDDLFLDGDHNNNNVIDSSATMDESRLGLFVHEDGKSDETLFSSQQQQHHQPVRRNARRRQQSKSSETLLERRLRREAKIKSLPHFQTQITWDLSNPNARTPLIYASDVAVEFGLTLNQTLDLARSIQEQIDDYVRSNVKYKIPISAFDPLENPRKDGVLYPPRYHVPKILFGGHGATNIASGKSRSLTKYSDEEDSSDAESEKYQPSKRRRKGSSGRSRPKLKHGSSKKNRASSSARSFNSMGGRRTIVGNYTVIKYSQKAHDIVSKDNLPQHDPKLFAVGEEYVQEVIARLRNESRVFCQSIIGQNGEDGEQLGKTYINKNHNCHICHTRRPDCVIFPCGNPRHAYCDLHTSQRLGFAAMSHEEENLDYCPICSLQCLCSKCKGDLGKIVSNFKKVCDKQNLGAQDVVIDDVKALKQGIHQGESRPKSKVAKRSKKSAKHKITKVAQRDKMSHQNDTSSDITTSHEIKPPMINIPQVPANELPSEMYNGINLDPSLENDYRTVFTPNGSYVRDDLPVPKAEDQQGVNVTFESETSEDGNIDYCLICANGNNGSVVCCDKCPRSFHPICLNLNENDLPDRWQCPQCPKDTTEQDGDRFKEGKYYEELVLKYQSHDGGLGDGDDNENRINSYCQSVLLLDKILAIIDRLLLHDFGDIFAVPVNAKDVPDYRKIVKKPMDLGTIKNNIIKGAYSSRLPDFKTVQAKEMSEMECIILEVLKDLELVWHNCLLYNLEGTPYYRMGIVMRQKCTILRQINVDDDLNEVITQKLREYNDECNKQNIRLKPWIPFSKNQFRVDSLKSGVNKNVAVFDPSTHMLVKQYTSLSSAVKALNLLRENFAFEMPSIHDSAMKMYINKSSNNPNILMFGYRWMPMDDLRQGKFVVIDSKNESNQIVRKVNTITNETLEEFDTVKRAFEDWRNTLYSSSSVNDDSNRMEDFIGKYLESGDTIDGIAWNRVSSIESKQSNRIITEALVKKEPEANDEVSGIGH